MSKWRERAREIKEAGVQERGNFQPSGTPLRIYNWWDEITDGGLPQENFCHFWRVVILYAPALFILLPVMEFLDTVAGKVVLALGYVALSLICWRLFGWDFFAVLMWLIPLGLAVLALVLYGGGMLFEWFGDNVWRDQWKQPLKTFGRWLLITVLATVVLGIQVLLFLDDGWKSLLLEVGIILGCALGFVAFAYTADWISGRRKLARQRRRDARVADVQTSLHSVKSPGIVSRFFTGLGDFIVFFAQIVRVKKWKVCPLVTIPHEEVSGPHPYH